MERTLIHRYFATLETVDIGYQNPKRGIREDDIPPFVVVSTVVVSDLLV